MRLKNSLDSLRITFPCQDFSFVGYSGLTEPPLEHANALVPKALDGHRHILLSLYESESMYKIIPNVAQTSVSLNSAAFQMGTNGECHHLSLSKLHFSRF